MFGLPWWVDYVIVGASFIGGLLGIPMLIYFIGPGLQTIRLAAPLGRLHWILAALGNGRTVAVVQPNMSVELCHAKEDEFYYNGEWHDLEDSQNWDYLGLRPFGITYVKGDEVYGDLLAEPARGQNNLAVTDGGVGLLERVRQGTKFYTNYPDGVDDGYLIDMTALSERLRGVGDNSLLKRGKDLGLQKHGGDSSMDTKWFIAGIIIAAGAGYALTTIQLVFV